MGTFAIIWGLSILGFVGIMLVVFRRSDQSSKSLEKVKHYANKRNEEFDQYVEEKISQLKDLSVSIEVQEKTGIVILDKISGEVDALSEKIEHIEVLNNKVLGYNVTMDKMLNLTKELSEKYNHLKKDSQFLDQLDKKVKDGNRKLNVVEKSIDDITSEFIKNNDESLNKIKEDLLVSTNKISDRIEDKLKDTNNKVEEVNNTITSLKKDYENSAVESFSNFKSDLESLVETHRENVIKITKEGSALEEEAYKHILDKISERGSDLSSKLTEELNQLESSHSDKISILETNLENIENFTTKLETDNNLRLESIKDQINKQLLLLKEMNSNGVKELQNDFMVNFNDFKSRSNNEIEEMKSIIDGKLKEFNGDLEEIHSVKSEYISKIDETNSFVNQEISDTKDRLESGIYSLAKEIEGYEEKLRNEADKEIDKNILDYKNSINEKLDDIDDVKESISLIKSDLTNEISEIKDNLEESINGIKTDFNNKNIEVTTIFDQFKTHLDDLSEESKALLNNEREKLNSSIKSLELEQKDLSSEIKDRENEIRNQVAQLKDTLLSRTDIEINNTLEEFKVSIQNKLSDFNEFNTIIDNEKDTIENYMKSVYDGIQGDLNIFSEKINKQLNEERGELSLFMDEFGKSKDKFESEINKIKESSYNSISEKLDIFEDEYFDKLKEKKELIEVETSKWKDILDNSMNSLKNDSEEQIVANMEHVSNKVNIFKGEITSEYSEFKKNIEDRVANIISEIQSRENNVLTKSDELKISINNSITDIKTQVESLENIVADKHLTLTNSLKDISEEQDKYIQTTELFSKTDKLKSDLEKSITDLTEKIQAIDSKTDLIDTTNQKVNSLRELVSVVEELYTNLDNKQSNINNIEDKVDKVLQISDSVNENLERVKNSESIINDLQVRFRELKDLESDVALEYERLEAKGEILQETNKSIDSSFGSLQVIESKITLLKESLPPVTNQIDGLRDKLDKLQERETLINGAIETLSTLRESINDMDNQIEKMDKAREWIAGVETRLNESVRTADEQVKLMGALAQNKNNSESNKVTGAPNMDMREMVTKLAHNGWKAEDIARTTKLSRGEVELILELSPRK